MIKTIALLFLPLFAFSQTPVQTVRGIVSDADNGRPLAGANVVLPDFQATTGAVTDSSGNYRLEKIPVGRYRLQVSFVGFETVTVAEVLVESGKEVVQNVQLHERQVALQEVVVKAPVASAAHPVSVHVLTVEEQFRFPATFNDPARLAMSFPGVVGVDDQGNSISVRGNSPAAVKWHLEGVEIVNPNHTANAGTFSDRPTQAGGGVNILSAQLLGNSQFLTGAFPAEYGNALGGILDMRLRKGNERRHEFTAQAGFLGVEAAAEGPFSKKSGASYLVNYRYSFTGLLTAMGVDFGDESISFQDLSYNLVLPTENAGQFTVFAVGGGSENIFRSPRDSAKITEEKQLFDIEYKSSMFAQGFTHVLPVGKKSVLRSVFVASVLEHQRDAYFVEEPLRSKWEEDELEERKVALLNTFSHKWSARWRFKMGWSLLVQSQIGHYFFVFRQGQSTKERDFELRNSLWQPWLECQVTITPKIELTAGIHHQYNSASYNDHASTEPRATLRFTPDKRRELSLAASWQSQLPFLQAEISSSHEATSIKTRHFVAAFKQVVNKSLIFKTEIYLQHLSNIPASDHFSVINVIETYRKGMPHLFNLNTSSKNYGIDLSLQKFILDRYYFLAAASLFRSKFTPADGIERPTRFDNRHVFNLTGGREFSKIKGEKVRLKGINARLVWLGGSPATPIDVQASASEGFTVFDKSQPYTLRQPDYFRLDLRFYLKWNKTGRNSTLSLDIQNATNRRNVAYDYYDTLKRQVVTKRQLGLIPILSYRIEF